MGTQHPATVDDLYRVHGKAEIVNGEIVEMSPSGGLHGYAAGEVFASLREFGRAAGTGVAVSDNVGFIVDLPNRRSFCPDAAFWTGKPLTPKFFDGAPAFAVEVRSEEDYGPAAERRLAQKRADYFAAGTLVVWDVLMREGTLVRAYRADAPGTPTEFAPGTKANAEPAVPGWAMAVDDLVPV